MSVFVTEGHKETKTHDLSTEHYLFLAWGPVYKGTEMVCRAHTRLLISITNNYCQSCFAMKVIKFIVSVLLKNTSGFNKSRALLKAIFVNHVWLKNVWQFMALYHLCHFAYMWSPVSIDVIVKHGLIL